MRKKILLTTDFSKGAWNAIAYALELYKNTECYFYVVNTYTAAGYLKGGLLIPEPGEDAFNRAKQESEEGLVRVSRMITFREENNPKHEFTTLSMYKDLLDAIKKLVEEKDIDLVVMGTKGETNASNILFGSNAVMTMEKVRNCPVLVVPEDTDSIPPKEIVFPTSYKTHYKKHELEHLIEIAELSKAAIRILHVEEEDQLDDDQLEHKKLLEEYFNGLDYSYHTLTHLAVPDAIHSFVESRDSDMVAFINKKHTFFGSFLSKPLVKEIGYHSKVPILVMHDLRN